MEAAIEVASNLSPDDYREVVEGYGQDPLQDLPKNAFIGDSYYFKAPNGEIAAMGGVHSNGLIWMLTTPTVQKYPLTFSRECQRMLEIRPEKLLWNIADKRNKIHLKLLKFLGFKFLREVTYGPNNLKFIEFCKINVHI